MITTPTQAQIGLYSVPTSKPIPQLIFHWRFNCANFRDPNGQSNLRKFDGRDSMVQAFMLEDPRLKSLIWACKMIAAEKLNYTSIAFFDHHGKWISPAVAEIVARELDTLGYNIAITHTGLGGK